MSKRPYPKKKDEERRVVISFTLSDDRLRWFREMICLQTGQEPDLDQIRAVARDIAQSAIDERIKHKINFDNAIFL